SVELECTFHRHAMKPFRMVHKLCKHHSTSDVSGLAFIRSSDGIVVCRVRMSWPELHGRDHKQSNDGLSTHGSNEKEISHGRVSWQAHRNCIAIGPLDAMKGCKGWCPKRAHALYEKQHNNPL